MHWVRFQLIVWVHVWKINQLLSRISLHSKRSGFISMWIFYLEAFNQRTIWIHWEFGTVFDLKMLQCVRIRFCMHWICYVEVLIGVEAEARALNCPSIEKIHRHIPSIKGIKCSSHYWIELSLCFEYPTGRRYHKRKLHIHEQLLHIKHWKCNKVS